MRSNITEAVRYLVKRLCSCFLDLLVLFFGCSFVNQLQTDLAAIFSFIHPQVLQIISKHRYLYPQSRCRNWFHCGCLLGSNDDNTLLCWKPLRTQLGLQNVPCFLLVSTPSKVCEQQKFVQCLLSTLLYRMFLNLYILLTFILPFSKNKKEKMLMSATFITHHHRELPFFLFL